MAASAAHQIHRWLPSLQSALGCCGIQPGLLKGQYPIWAGRSLSPFNAFGSIKKGFLMHIKGYIQPTLMGSLPFLHCRNSQARPTWKSRVCGHFPGHASLHCLTAPAQLATSVAPHLLHDPEDTFDYAASHSEQKNDNY